MRTVTFNCRTAKVMAARERQREGGGGFSDDFTFVKEINKR